MRKKAQKAQKTRETLAQVASLSPKAGIKAGERQEEQKSPVKGRGKAGKPQEAGNPSTAKTLGEISPAPAVVPRVRMKPAQWKPIVLATLRQMPVWRIAAQSAGITRQALLEYRDRHPEFALACELAKTEGFELLRATTLQRATTGWKRPIFSKDKEGNPVQVGEENMYSDRLAEIWLKAQYPDEFNPKIQQELSGPGGSPLAPAVIAPTIIFAIPDNGRLPKSAEVIPAPALAEPQEEQEEPGK